MAADTKNVPIPVLDFPRRPCGYQGTDFAKEDIPDAKLSPQAHAGANRKGPVRGATSPWRTLPFPMRVK